MSEQDLISKLVHSSRREPVDLNKLFHVEKWPPTRESEETMERTVRDKSVRDQLKET